MSLSDQVQHILETLKQPLGGRTWLVANARDRGEGSSDLRLGAARRQLRHDLVVVGNEPLGSPDRLLRPEGFASDSSHEFNVALEFFHNLCESLQVRQGLLVGYARHERGIGYRTRDVG